MKGLLYLGYSYYSVVLLVSLHHHALPTTEATSKNPDVTVSRLRHPNNHVTSLRPLSVAALDDEVVMNHDNKNEQKEAVLPNKDNVDTITDGDESYTERHLRPNNNKKQKKKTKTKKKKETKKPKKKPKTVKSKKGEEDETSSDPTTAPDMAEIELLQSVFSTSVRDMDQFMNADGTARDDLQHFLALVRAEIPEELGITLSDDEILRAVMIPRERTTRSLHELQEYQRELIGSDCIFSFIDTAVKLWGLIMTTIDGVLANASTKVGTKVANAALQENDTVVAYLLSAFGDVMDVEKAGGAFFGLIKDLEVDFILDVVRNEIPWEDWLGIFVAFGVKIAAAMCTGGLSLGILKGFEITLALKSLTDTFEPLVRYCQSIDLPIPLEAIDGKCTDGLNVGDCSSYDDCPYWETKIWTFELEGPKCTHGEVCCLKEEPLCLDKSGYTGTCWNSDGDGKSCAEHGAINGLKSGLQTAAEVGPCSVCCVDEVSCQTSSGEEGICADYNLQIEGETSDRTCLWINRAPFVSDSECLEYGDTTKCCLKGAPRCQSSTGGVGYCRDQDFDPCDYPVFSDDCSYGPSYKCCLDSAPSCTTSEGSFRGTCMPNNDDQGCDFALFSLDCAALSGSSKYQCCVNDPPQCSTLDEEIVGTCIDTVGSKRGCGLPLLLDDECSQYGEVEDRETIQCCPNSDLCGFGGTEGSCVESEFCERVGGVQISGDCAGGGDGIVCCKEFDFLPVGFCMSAEGMFPGVCRSPGECLDNEIAVSQLGSEYACTGRECCVECVMNDETASILGVECCSTADCETPGLSCIENKCTDCVAGVNAECCGDDDCAVTQTCGDNLVCEGEDLMCKECVLGDCENRICESSGGFSSISAEAAYLNPLTGDNDYPLPPGSSLRVGSNTASSFTLGSKGTLVGGERFGTLRFWDGEDLVAAIFFHGIYLGLERGSVYYQWNQGDEMTVSWENWHFGDNEYDLNAQATVNLRTGAVEFCFGPCSGTEIGPCTSDTKFMYEFGVTIYNNDNDFAECNLWNKFFNYAWPGENVCVCGNLRYIIQPLP